MGFDTIEINLVLLTKSENFLIVKLVNWQKNFRASKRMSEGEELNTEMEDQDPVLYNLMKMLTQLEMHQDREEE